MENPNKTYKDISIWSEIQDHVYGKEETGRKLRPHKSLAEKLKLESSLVQQESLNVLKEFESI